MSAALSLVSLAAAPAALPVVDGKFELGATIGAGRGTEIFDAREIATQRPCVLKLASTVATEGSATRARLRREAEALSTIQGEHVLIAHDAGECPWRGPYLVTERLIGRGLDGLLASRGALGVDLAMHVLREVAAGLSEVHRYGFVHGDVKPANLFVSQSRDGGERIKLIDFGAATEVGSAGADLYALGLVVLECLGVHPGQAITRPGTRGPASSALGSVAGVPRGVIALLDEMLARDPLARPPSADAVLARLGPASGPTPRLLLGYLQRSAPPVSADPVWRPVARSRTELHDLIDVDRRAQQRAPYTTPVRLLHRGGTLDGRSEDISTSGLMIIVQGDVKKLQGQLHLRFALPTTGVMTTVPVAVRWFRSTPGHTAIGLQLLQVRAEAAAAIETWVAPLHDRG